MLGVHYFARPTNLVVEAMSKQLTLVKIEGLFGGLYSFFAHMPKQHLEFTQLAQTLDSNGFKILWNYKTRWISMLFPLKRVVDGYQDFVEKMALEKDELPSVAANFER